MNPDRILWMIEHRPAVEGRPNDLPEMNAEGDGSDVRCPLCGWTPAEKDRWACRCLHSWNTFDTGGVCPNCLYQWAYTQCLACHGWSLHSEWYPKD